VVSAESAVSVRSAENDVIVVTAEIVANAVSVQSVVSVVSVQNRRKQLPQRIPLLRTSATPSTTWTFKSFQKQL
jgi:hypothetical protein